MNFPYETKIHDKNWKQFIILYFYTIYILLLLLLLFILLYFLLTLHKNSYWVRKSFKEFHWFLYRQNIQRHTMASGSFHVIIDQRVQVTLDLFLHCKVPHSLSPDDVWNLRSFLPSLGTKNSGLKKKHKKNCFMIY